MVESSVLTKYYHMHDPTWNVDMRSIKHLPVPVTKLKMTWKMRAQAARRIVEIQRNPPGPKRKTVGGEGAHTPGQATRGRGKSRGVRAHGPNPKAPAHGVPSPPLQRKAPAPDRSSQR